MIKIDDANLICKLRVINLLRISNIDKTGSSFLQTLTYMQIRPTLN